MLLAKAIDYLKRQHTKRPLWKGQRQIKGGLEEPPHPLYPALSNSRESFKRTLLREYIIWCKHNSVPEQSTYVGNRKVWDYPKKFLDSFAEHLNIPDLPPGYALATHIDHYIEQRINLETQLKTIGVEVLDDGGRERTAYPEALLRFLAYPRPFSIALGNILNIKKEQDKSSEPETNPFYQDVIQVSIAAYHEYLTHLCAVPLVLGNSISGGKVNVFAEVTNNCMKMDSLELQIKNWGKFLAAQNDTTQARQ
jgi:hypothetical protein